MDGMLLFEATKGERGDGDAERLAAMADEGRTLTIFKRMGTHRKMRLLSEKALSDSLDWHLEEGVSYHVVSYGDVDALTFMRHVCREQRVRYAIVATWCMAQVDADEIDRMVERGIIGRVDYVVGEVFKTHARYREIRKTLARTAEMCGGRVLRCRTHMKVMVLYGERYDAVIESSANIDTNPRAEQTCITVDTGLADFYRGWFDALPNFDETPDRWQPWKG